MGNARSLQLPVEQQVQILHAFRILIIHIVEAGDPRLNTDMSTRTIPGLKIALKHASWAILAFCTVAGPSCTHKLVIPAVTYQSLRTARNLDPGEIPSEAKIMVQYNVTRDQKLEVYVKNLTDEIMHIDQTQSFYVNPSGQSLSYYDPTVRTTSTTSSSANETGGIANLGAIGGALGVGGVLGGILNGINVGGSHTAGKSETFTVAKTDLPVISLAPKSTIKMSKDFDVDGLFSNIPAGNYSVSDNPFKFSVCISYAVGEHDEKDKIVTDMYVNSSIIMNTQRPGRVNSALRSIYINKPDCLSEPWYRIYFVNDFADQTTTNAPTPGVGALKTFWGNNVEVNDYFINGSGLVDYK